MIISNIGGICIYETKSYKFNNKQKISVWLSMLVNQLHTIKKLNRTYQGHKISV
jgi:hypothetical protein